MSAADIVQLVIAVATAGAAVAAWIAAISSRESARESAIGQLISVHSKRLNALSRLHSTLAWISEGGGPRKSLTYMERVALMTWHPIGTIVVRGIEFRGMIETTGLDLPFCRQVAEDMMSMKVKGVPIRQADAEVREAMKAENTTLATLQKQVDRMTSAESGRRRRRPGGPVTAAANGSPEVAVDLTSLSVARSFRTAVPSPRRWGTSGGPWHAKSSRVWWLSSLIALKASDLVAGM